MLPQIALNAGMLAIQAHHARIHASPGQHRMRFWWLVELVRDGLPAYYAGYKVLSEPVLVSDPNIAAWFETRAEAEAVALTLPPPSAGRWEAREHGFSFS